MSASILSGEGEQGCKPSYFVVLCGTRSLSTSWYIFHIERAILGGPFREEFI